MKCPSCGYNSFDHLEYCKKCGSPLGRETEPQTSEAGERGRGRSRSRPEKESAGPVTGDLFLDIPIRDTELHARPEGRSTGAARRRRTSGAGTEPEAESYELFPVSKVGEAGDHADEKAGSVSRTAQETPPVPEHEPDAPRPDPFAFIENEAGPYEQEPDRPEEWYGRENDVYNLAGFIPRALALAIDIVVVSLIALLAYFAGLFVLYGFYFGSYGSGDMLRPLYMVLFLLSSTYFVFFHGYGGMTVGKMLLGIKLINRYGEGIGVWDAFIRWIGYY
ncbi:MAG: RDD family protein, partial [Candidatus Dadabacteria bacterium]